MVADCELCGGTGWRPAVQAAVGGARVRAAGAPLVPCECREHLRAEQVLESAGIPTKYLACDFSNFNCYWEGARNDSLWAAFKTAQAYADEMLIGTPTTAPGLLFLGPPGVGKTHLMVALLRRFCGGEDKRALFVDYQELLRRIQDCYNAAARTTEYELLRPILSAGVLAIDDLGNNRISDWVEDTVTYIVNHRYSRDLPTLFTANLAEERMSGEPGKRVTEPTFDERLGMRVASRLREMCRFVKMNAADYRRRTGRVM